MFSRCGSFASLVFRDQLNHSKEIWRHTLYSSTAVFLCNTCAMSYIVWRIKALHNKEMASIFAATSSKVSVDLCATSLLIRLAAVCITR